MGTLLRSLIAVIATVLVGIGVFFLATVGVVIGLVVFVVLFILFKIYGRRGNGQGGSVFYYTNLRSPSGSSEFGESGKPEQVKIYLNGQELSDVNAKQQPPNSDAAEVYDIKPEDYSITDKEK